MRWSGAGQSIPLRAAGYCTTPITTSSRGTVARPGSGRTNDAIRFSWIATAELADIAASFSHPNGEPLFDLSRPPD